jgi:L-malate glycosyltransferase
MKVLLITTSYPDFQGSTRGIFIQRLCRELVSLGVEVAVLTPRVYGESPLLEEEPGIRTYRFRYPSGNTPLNRLGSIPVFAMGVYMLSGLFAALALIRKERPDVIHGNWIVPTGLIASLAGLLTGTPVVNTARGMDMRVSERGIIRHLFNLAVRLSSRVTVVSESMRERAILKDAEVIASGVDTAFFRVEPGRGSSTILHLRSFEPVYDAGTVLQAFPSVLERIPGARLILAGSGSLEVSLQELAKGLGIGHAVEFIGVVQNREVPALMGRAEIYVSASVADGTSIALLEAIAAGLVPVVTDIEANRNHVTHERDGFLFRARDPHDCAHMLVRALTEGIGPEILEEKRARLARTGAWSSVANRFITSYNEARSLSGGGQAR